MPNAKQAGANILVIDDDASIRKVTALRLEREGYRVLTAPEGEEGLRIAKAERPDVILLDILMPRMDGREVLRRLKADPETQTIPVILLTVIGAHDDTYGPLGPGYLFHLSKPYHPDELVAKIQAVLTKPAGESARPVG